MYAPILHRDYWTTVSRLVHTTATGGGCNGSISNYPPIVTQCQLSTKDDIYLWPGRQATTDTDMHTHTHAHVS